MLEHTHTHLETASLALCAGLRINDQGLLIDEKTGEVINEMTGATRFDVAVRGAPPRLLERPAPARSLVTAWP